MSQSKNVTQPLYTLLLGQTLYRRKAFYSNVTNMIQTVEPFFLFISSYKEKFVTLSELLTAGTRKNGKTVNSYRKKTLDLLRTFQLLGPTDKGELQSRMFSKKLDAVLLFCKVGYRKNPVFRFDN